MTTDSQINQPFNNLDAWRHLPAYQLERRADIFFSLYLPAVLKTRFGLKHEPVLIPEFPCRIGTVYGNESNQSFKIDYLAVSVPDKKAYFVELKTDMASRNKEQDNNMFRAKSLKLGELLEGIPLMQKASVQKEKYDCLLQLLADKHITTECDFDIDIVYIQPQPSHEISFTNFAEEIVKPNSQDPVAKRFAESLRQWATTEAGTPSHD
jgi:hypothetical protein